MSHIDERIVTERAIGKVIALRQSHAELLQWLRVILTDLPLKWLDPNVEQRAREAVRNAEALATTPKQDVEESDIEQERRTR